MSTREELIEVAGRMFAERGYDGTSVRDIINAAGANLGAVTYHFGSKETLFSEVVSRKMGPLREIGRKVAESSKSPDEKIRAMMEGFAIHVFHENPGLKSFFMEMLTGGDRLPQAAVEGIRRRNKIFADIMREGIKRRIFRDCDIECLAWIFFGMLSSYILFQPLIGKTTKRGMYSRAYIKRIVNTALEVFMNGVRIENKTAKRRTVKKR